tara:strand:- start:197 stop:418 length:222 start_codon:yes stop_codon:yes gene_type:complete
MPNIIVEQCLSALKREDVKTEIKSWIAPISDIVLGEITLYLYIVGVFMFVSLLLQLGLFTLVLRIRKSTNTVS